MGNSTIWAGLRGQLKFAVAPRPRFPRRCVLGHGFGVHLTAAYARWFSFALPGLDGG